MAKLDKMTMMELGTRVAVVHSLGEIKMNKIYVFLKSKIISYYMLILYIFIHNTMIIIHIYTHADEAM